jgi:hypothetical protein
MRDINPGEELTTDYALFDDYDGAMECRCGTPSCRGTVGGHDWRRPTCSASTETISPPTYFSGCQLLPRRSRSH